MPSPQVTALALFGALLCLAAGESLYGDLDQADSIAAIAAGSGRLTAGGLVQLGAAILLGLAVAGLGPVVRGSVTGRIGWVLLAIAVPCLGAFSMFHLILVETGASGLNQAAMEQFILERFQGPGLWSVPVTYFAFFGLLSLLLVLIALVRRGVTSPWAPALFGAGMVGDLVISGMVGEAGESVEVGSIWALALAGAVAAYGLWRAGRVAPATAPLTPDPVTS